LRSAEESLSAAQIASAVKGAGLSPLADETVQKFANYYSLLTRWNTRLNLTAIRDPEETLHRHFVECIFFAQHLPANISTFLDFGSGAGFPGIPVALCRPEIHVTLAESQGKKASFLREVIRSLNIGADVYAGRVEEMVSSLRFDVVGLRAVDKMQDAVNTAATRVAQPGWLAILATPSSITLPDGYIGKERLISGSEKRAMILASLINVPRGTPTG
jgi:16S rRNA (guanine527-N7)-methyltransferase